MNPLPIDLEITWSGSTIGEFYDPPNVKKFATITSNSMKLNKIWIAHVFSIV